MDELPHACSYSLSCLEQPWLLAFHLSSRLLLDIFNLVLPTEGIIFLWWGFIACILDISSVTFPQLETTTLPLPSPTCPFIGRVFQLCCLVTFTSSRASLPLAYIILGTSSNISAMFFSYIANQGHHAENQT